MVQNESVATLFGLKYGYLVEIWLFGLKYGYIGLKCMLEDFTFKCANIVRKLTRRKQNVW